MSDKPLDVSQLTYEQLLDALCVPPEHRDSVPPAFRDHAMELLSSIDRCRVRRIHAERGEGMKFVPPTLESGPTVAVTPAAADEHEGGTSARPSDSDQRPV